MPATLGSATISRFLVDPEAHKLSLEFDVETAQVVHKGDAVVLSADGKVQAAASGDPLYKVIGYSLHDGDATVAGKTRVTVVMRGFAVVYAEAAAASLDAGAVKLGAWNTGNLRREFAAITGADDAAKLALLAGHNLSQVTSDGDQILVVLI